MWRRFCLWSCLFLGAAQTGKVGLDARLQGPGWRQATFASKVEVEADGKALRVTREVDGGLEVLRTPLPAVVTADLRLNVPRYATLPNIMKAKKKPLATVQPSELGLDLEAAAASGGLEILGVAEPPARQGGKKVASVDDLVEAVKATGVL